MTWLDFVTCRASLNSNSFEKVKFNHCEKVKLSGVFSHHETPKITCFGYKFDYNLVIFKIILFMLWLLTILFQ